MPILDKNNKEQVEKYKKYIDESEYTRLTQSLEWASVKKNWVNECLYIERDGNIVASMSILLEKLPYINKYLAYCPRGPICDFYDTNLVTELVNEFKQISKKYNIFCLKMDPAIKEDMDLIAKYKNLGYKSINKISDNDLLIQPVNDAILNIENITEEELIKKFSEKTRYNIRLAKRKGVEIYYSREKSDLETFYELYKVTTIRDKIGCRPYEYFERMLEAFDDKHLRIYIAKHEEDKLSAAIAVTYGPEMFYLYGASSNEKRNLMPNYLMQWEMIKWGIEKNCKLYNFGGIIHLDKENGLYKFKTGFCKEEGITKYIGEIDKVYDKKIYFVYKSFIPFIKKIKRKFRKK